MSKPELVSYLTPDLARIRFGTKRILYATGVLRKKKACWLCGESIEVGELGWRELGTSSLYRAKRVGLCCWWRGVEGNPMKGNDEETEADCEPDTKALAGLPEQNLG